MSACVSSDGVYFTYEGNAHLFLLETSKPIDNIFVYWTGENCDIPPISYGAYFEVKYSDSGRRQSSWYATHPQVYHRNKLVLHATNGPETVNISIYTTCYVMKWCKHLLTIIMRQASCLIHFICKSRNKYHSNDETGIEFFAKHLFSETFVGYVYNERQKVKKLFVNARMGNDMR